MRETVGASRRWGQPACLARMRGWSAQRLRTVGWRWWRFAVRR